jgi:hypothetical protein
MEGRWNAGLWPACGRDAQCRIVFEFLAPMKVAPCSGELILARPFKAGFRRNNNESVALATADLNKINNLDWDRCLILVRRRDATHNVRFFVNPGLKRPG